MILFTAKHRNPEQIRIAVFHNAIDVSTLLFDSDFQITVFYLQIQSGSLSKFRNLNLPDSKSFISSIDGKLELLFVS